MNRLNTLDNCDNQDTRDSRDDCHAYINPSHPGNRQDHEDKVTPQVNILFQITQNRLNVVPEPICHFARSG